MSRLGGFRVPPFKAALNVAWQTVRQQIPEKGGGESSSERLPPERVRFAAQTTSFGGVAAGPTSGGSFDQTELTSTNPFNPFVSKEGSMAEDSFSTPYTGGYQNIDGFQTGGEGYSTGEFNQTDGYSQQPGGFPAPHEGTFRKPSVESCGSSSAFGGEGGESKTGIKINEWQAAWNVTNAIQGMFIVSLPFAVLRGGYWAIFAMVGVAYICCYTGKCLVECLYEPEGPGGRPVRVRSSYVAIAKECFGPRFGARIVNAAQIVELLMTCILYVVVCGDLLAGAFPTGALDTRSWMMFVGLFLIPLSFLRSLKSVSVLSFWCTMSHLFINAIILGYCLLEIGNWGWSKVKWSFDVESFPISLGVIVFSYTSQIFLPSLEGSMEDPSKFAWMLDWSHIAAAIFKALFGYICFLTFQNDTQQVITNNLHSAGFKGFVNFCLVIKALLSYPLPYYAACELLERMMFRGKPKTVFPTIWARDGELKVWGLAWKLGVIVFTIMMAISIPHFSILMGFIGSFTGTMLSFIWPCYFHLKLKRHTMDTAGIAYDYFIIFLGVLFGIIGVYDSGSALIKAYEIGLPF